MPKANKSRKKSKTGATKRSTKRGGGCKLKQKGGVVLPSEYFGVDSGRYSDNPKSCQNSTSRGSVSADGKWAGTTMKPQHAGGKKSKKMKKRKNTKKANKKKKTKKTKKIKEIQKP